MNIPSIKELTLISWIGFGVQILGQKENITYISVPRNSYNKTSEGEDLAGEALVKHYSDVMKDLGFEDLKIKFKIRDEYWTPEKEKQAIQNIKKQLYGGL